MIARAPGCVGGYRSPGLSSLRKPRAEHRPSDDGGLSVLTKLAADLDGGVSNLNSARAAGCPWGPGRGYQQR